KIFYKSLFIGTSKVNKIFFDHILSMGPVVSTKTLYNIIIRYFDDVCNVNHDIIDLILSYLKPSDDKLSFISHIFRQYNNSHNDKVLAYIKEKKFESPNIYSILSMLERSGYYSKVLEYIFEYYQEMVNKDLLNRIY